MILTTLRFQSKPNNNNGQLNERINSTFKIFHQTAFHDYVQRINTDVKIKHPKRILKDVQRFINVSSPPQFES